MLYHTEQEPLQLWRHRCDFLQEQVRLLSLQSHPHKTPLSQTSWIDLFIEMKQLTWSLEQMATKWPPPPPSQQQQNQNTSSLSPALYNFHKRHIVIFTFIIFFAITFICYHSTFSTY
ncbi:hypothetical protein MOUN0_F04654 [Monosporozyma unispora]|nr:hypothetical protein C6P44_002792 [Kazachstania unispora]